MRRAKALRDCPLAIFRARQCGLVRVRWLVTIARSIDRATTKAATGFVPIQVGTRRRTAKAVLPQLPGGSCNPCFSFSRPGGRGARRGCCGQRFKARFGRLPKGSGSQQVVLKVRGFLDGLCLNKPSFFTLFKHASISNTAWSAVPAATSSTRQLLTKNIQRASRVRQIARHDVLRLAHA